jgi:hypothetical protein
MLPVRRTAAALCLVAVLAFAKDKEAQPPRKAYNAKTYPALDDHKDEQVAIAADPFDLGDKTAFLVTPYADNDILPIRVVITNDSDQALSLSQLQLQLQTVNPKAKIDPLSADDLARRLSRQEGRPDQQKPNPLPIPLPRKKTKSTMRKEWSDEIENLRWKWLAVEPHSTVSGFYFFDVRDIDHPLAGGHLYLTGIRDERGQELMYFDIPLEKYLTYQPAAP